MSEQLIVIEESGRVLSSRLAAAKPVTARSARQLRTALDKYEEAICVAQRPGPMMRLLVDLDGFARMSHSLLLLSAPKDEERTLLNALFENVVAPNEKLSLLKTDELMEVLASPRRANLFVGGVVVPGAKTVLLLRGNLEPLPVPFSLFKPRPHGPHPDFGDFEIVDWGQAVRLGKYEAAGDAILYELDPEFRRQEKKRQVSTDKSFGGALRRLRLQRGIGREDFPGVSAKTIARLERGDVKEPHTGTLAAIAEKLGVRPEEIATF
jgi:DNA-binding Xre family transcriptional regulator